MKSKNKIKDKLFSFKYGSKFFIFYFFVKYLREFIDLLSK
jgi:hypothetical protein